MLFPTEWSSKWLKHHVIFVIRNFQTWLQRWNGVKFTELNFSLLDCLTSFLLDEFTLDHVSSNTPTVKESLLNYSIHSQRSGYFGTCLNYRLVCELAPYLRWEESLIPNRQVKPKILWELQHCVFSVSNLFKTNFTSKKFREWKLSKINSCALFIWISVQLVGDPIKVFSEVSSCQIL